MLSPDYRRGQAPPNKGKTYPAEVLTPGEITAIFGATPKTGPTGKRDRALLSVLMCGLRIAEALALLPKDVDPGAGTVAILRGKGHKRRTIGVPPETLAYLDVWMAERARLDLNGRHPLFCVVAGPSRGRRMGASAWRDTLKRYARKADVDRRVTPHTFRHTCAFTMHVIQGLPLKVVQMHLGHSHAGTTDRYVSHLGAKDIVAAGRGYAWQGGADVPATPAVVQLLQLLADPGVADLVAQLRAA